MLTKIQKKSFLQNNSFSFKITGTKKFIYFSKWLDLKHVLPCAVCGGGGGNTKQIDEGQ